MNKKQNIPLVLYSFPTNRNKKSEHSASTKIGPMMENLETVDNRYYSDAK